MESQLKKLFERARYFNITVFCISFTFLVQSVYFFVFLLNNTVSRVIIMVAMAFNVISDKIKLIIKFIH